MVDNKRVLDQIRVLNDGWQIIVNYNDSRQSARQLCRLFAEVLKASTVGMEFNDVEGYSWKEQVDQVGANTSTGFWERPFTDNQSRWFFDGGKSLIPEFSPVLDLLTHQWKHYQNPPEERPGYRHRMKSVSSSYNPAWFSVSQLSRQVLDVLPRLWNTLHPLLLIGESGSGRAYLAEIMHRNGPFPSEPFAVYRNDVLNRMGTLLVPDWDKINHQKRKTLLAYKQRIIAKTSDINNASEISRQWKSETNDSGLILRVPSLRERQEDIPLLANHFLEMAALNTGRKAPGIEPMTLEVLKKNHWPGNIRELEETMVYILNRTPFRTQCINVEDLPPTVRGMTTDTVNGEFSSRFTSMEIDVMKLELQQQNGIITHTARALGMTPRQVSWRLKRYGIDPKAFKKRKPDKIPSGG